MQLDNFIPVIPVEDDIVHTTTHPYCSDPTCDCHEDEALIAQVNQAVADGFLTAEEATRLVKGEQL
jgi:hypothetical protein